MNSMGPRDPVPVRRRTNPWIILMDYLPTKRIPRESRRPFFEKNYSYTVQLHATTFAYSNRIPSKILCDALAWHYKDQFTIVRRRKIHALYQYFNDFHDGFSRRSRYFAYNVVHNKVIDLNLQIRRRREIDL